MNDFQDDALIQEFLTESQEHLEGIEPDLLALEKQAPVVSQDIVNRIFRAIHSIKGASGFFGFNHLKDVSHLMEGVLMRIRDGKLTPEPHVVQPLLIGVDALNQMVDDIQNSEDLNTVELEKALSHYMINDTPYDENETASTEAPKASTTSTASITKPSPPQKSNNALDREAIQKAQRIGQTVYTVHVETTRYLFDAGRSYADFIKTVESIGTLFASTVQDEEQETPPDEFFVTFSTVLEDFLVAVALDVEPEKIHLFELPEEIVAEEVSSPVVPTVQAKVQASSAPKEVAPNTNEASASPQANTTATDANNDTLRVRVDLLNTLMDCAGELVLVRNQLMRAVHDDAHAEMKNPAVAGIFQNLNNITNRLQDHIMQTRMQPVENVFRRFPRVVRDLAKQVGKKIQLELLGQDVELDKSILEGLSDPLTHMIRNACDHGLETPEERKQAGKNPVGTIVLHAFHEGGQIHLKISDDGKGINTEAVGQKAIKNGILTQAEFNAMSHNDKLNLIFHPGLSTASQVTDLSGRGVGMDVVRSNIEKLGGHIFLESTEGKGSSITLQLPLTLAIIPSLIVGLGKERFAIPRISIRELVHVSASEVHQKIERIGDASVLRLRGAWLPLVKLSDVLHLTPMTERRQTIEDSRYNDPKQVEQMPESRRQSYDSDYTILVLTVGTNQYGLLVDEVLDTEDIVVKPLSCFLQGNPCFSGTTIMGDGSVAMICDATGIANHSHLDFSGVEAEQLRRSEARERTQKLQAQEHNVELDSQSLLLFCNHSHEPIAVPLNEVLRLEQIATADIEHIGQREFILHQGHTMALIRLEDYLCLKAPEETHEEVFLIVPSAGQGRIGIVVSHIIDTLDTTLHLDTGFIEAPYLYGSALINDKVTMLLNLNELLESQSIVQETSYNTVTL